MVLVLPPVNRALPTLLVLLAIFFCPAARAAPKIASVDFQKILASYYKLDELNSELQVIKERVSKDRRIETLKELNKQREELINSSSKTTKQDNKALQKEQVEKMQDLRERYQEFGVELNAFRNHITEEIKSLRNDRLAAYSQEIREAVVQFSSENGYDWVVDASGETNSKLPAVLYSKNATDVTAEIIAIVNRDAPPEFSADKNPSPDIDKEQNQDNKAPKPNN